MLRLITLAALLSLTGCQQPTKKQPDNAVELLNTQAQIERLEKENAALKAQQSKAKPAPKTTKDGLTDGIYQDSEVATSSSSRNLCWQDYCPCEPGQDGEGMEASLCRNLKADIRVDDDIMAAAAMARDARRQIREFERENPGF